MAKKQTLAGYLGGIEQPVSADNVPELHKPLMPGDDFDDDKFIESLSEQSSFNPDEEYVSPYESKPKLDYKGKYYKGSGTDPFQQTIQGENQPWTSKLVNGLLGNTLSVGTKVVTMAGETLGGAWDLISNIIPGVAEQRKEEKGTAFPHLFENFITTGMRYVEDDLIKEKMLPVYGGQDYYKDSLLSKMGDMKFWSSDAADAAAFTAAAWLTAGAFTKAAKTAGWAVKAVKYGKEVNLQA